MRKFLVILLAFCLTFILTGCFSGQQEHDPDYVFLEKPSGLNFDIKTRTLSWNAVSHADNYQVDSWIQGQQKLLITKATRVTYQVSDITPATDVDIVSFFFKVKAVEYTRGHTTYSSNDQNYSEIDCYYVRWVQLETPENITFDRKTGRLSWKAVDNADNYIVHYTTPSSEPLECPQTANTYYDFGHTFDDVTPVSFAVQACSTDQYYRISVLPNRWYESLISLPKPVFSAVTYPATGYVKIEWHPVPNAAYYNVSYRVEYTSGSLNSYSNLHVYDTYYQFATNNVRSITITIYAYSAGYGYWSSDSTSYTYRP
jgi:hypothetical protein